MSSHRSKLVDDVYDYANKSFVGCNCANWTKNLGNLQILNTCPEFSHCPWCGNELQEVAILTCYDCKKPIADNDDASVCIQCGGMSRRL